MDAPYKYCHKCLEVWKEPSEPGPRKTCINCLSDLHVCLNCRFYNKTKSNQCEVNDIEAIVDKEKANFCEDFSFAYKPFPSNKEKIANARDVFDKLFKKK